MADVFISYKSEDRQRVEPVANGLEAEGFTVWWDPELRGGDAYDEVIEQELRDAAVVVVLWTKGSVASRWVRSEATIADRRGVLVPATLEPCERPVAFELAQTVALDHWRGDRTDVNWQRFVRDIRARMQGVPIPDELRDFTPRGHIGRPVLLALGAAALVFVASIVGSVVWSVQATPRWQNELTDAVRSIKIETSPGDLAHFTGRWSAKDPLQCTDPMTVTLVDGRYLVMEHADGRRFKHGVQDLSRGNIRHTIQMEPLNEMGAFELWLEKDDQEFHLQRYGLTATERIWRRCG